MSQRIVVEFGAIAGRVDFRSDALQGVVFGVLPISNSSASVLILRRLARFKKMNPIAYDFL